MKRPRGAAPRSALLIVAGLVAGGCSALPSLTAGVCGNHILDEGETCDRDGPGCGAPGSDAACRYTCESGACADPDYSCGRDRVCRRELGTYTLAPAIGGAGDRFSLIDFDDDGLLDLADQGSREVTLFTNDGLGKFSLYASALALPDESVDHGFAVGRLAPDDPRPLLATMSTYTVDLASVGDHRIAPLVFAGRILPPSALQFIGGVRFSPGSPSSALYYDPAGPSLLAIAPDPTVTPITLDLSACGAAAGASATGYTTERFGDGTMGALVFDQEQPCVFFTTSTDDGPALGLRPVPITGIAAAADPGATLDGAALADLDGDGVPDLVGVLVTPGTATTDGLTHLVSWTAEPATRALGLPSLDATQRYLFEPTALSVGDFNGDGLDDVANYYELYMNAGPGLGFSPLSTDIDLPVYNFAPSALTGDVNADRATDLVLGGLDPGDIISCTGDGAAMPRFTCFSVRTDLSPITGLALADLNGDQVTDIVASGEVGQGIAGVPDGGVMSSAPPSGRIAVSFGVSRGFQDPIAQTLDVYRGDAVGVARSAPRQNPDPSVLLTNTDSLLVPLRLDRGLGLAQGRAVAGSVPAFGLPFFAFDVRIVDGNLYALRCDPDPAGYFTDCKVASYAGGDGAALAHDKIRKFSHLFDNVNYSGYVTRFRFGELPGDPLPSTLWVEAEGLWVGHIGDDSVETTLVPAPIMILNPVALEVVDVDGAADPAGDHRSEVVVVEAQGDVCQVLIAHVPRSGGPPGALTLAATVPRCISGGQRSLDPGYLVGTPFFLPGADDPSRRDLIMTVRGPDGAAHLATLQAKPDGTYGAPVLDPARFHAPGVTRTSTMASPADHRFLGAADLDGDGLLDLLFRAPDGAVIAYADSAP